MKFKYTLPFFSSDATGMILSFLHFDFSNRPAARMEPSVFRFGGRHHWKDTASHR